MSEPLPQRKVSGWVKGFVLFHLFAILVWTLPTAPEGVASGRMKGDFQDNLLAFNDRHLKTSPVRLYVLPTGVWQYWDMFAPNPSNTDFYGDAVLTYEDGTTEVLPLPRMKDLDIATKIPAERFRKFFERAHLESNSRVWRDFARAVAVKAANEKGRDPVIVQLRRHFRKIEPPGVPQPIPYNEYTFYTYNVEPDFLSRFKEAK